MSVFDQPLDDATVSEFFASLRASCDPQPVMNVVSWYPPDLDESTVRRIASLPSTHPICDMVRRAGPEPVDLARAFYVWAKRKRTKTRDQHNNLRRVFAALHALADALATLRADRDMIVADSLRLEPKELRACAAPYNTEDRMPSGRRGGRANEAWAFAALVSMLAQDHERATGQPAKARGTFLRRVRAGLAKVEPVQSPEALRKRVARALQRREAANRTTGCIRKTNTSP